ncbi:MAG: hypothetical protein K2O59_03560 [Lachnospiraceae bacterium]|nr:hypothetical protein [Lachnospiraceae bacterium]
MGAITLVLRGGFAFGGKVAEIARKYGVLVLHRSERYIIFVFFRRFLHLGVVELLFYGSFAKEKTIIMLCRDVRFRATCIV